MGHLRFNRFFVLAFLFNVFTLTWEANVGLPRSQYPYKPEDELVEVRDYINQLESNYRVQLKNDYGRKFTNLLHYTWDKMRICTKEGSTQVGSLWTQRTPIKNQLMAIFQLLLDFHVLPDDEEVVSQALKNMPPDLKKLTECDLTLSITDANVRQKYLFQYLFGIDQMPTENSQQWKDLCSPTMNFLQKYKQGSVFEIAQLRYILEQIILKANWKLFQESVRIDHEASFNQFRLTVTQTTAVFESFLKHLVMSLLYFRHQRVASGEDATNLRPITAQALQTYLQSFQLWLDFTDRQYSVESLGQMIDRLAAMKMKKLTRSWMQVPGIFCDYVLKTTGGEMIRAFGPKVDAKVENKCDRKVAFGDVIRAIDDDYCRPVFTDAEEKMKRTFYRKFLFLSIKKGLLQKIFDKKSCWTPGCIAYTLGIGSLFVISGIAVRKYWPFREVTFDPTVFVSPMANFTISSTYPPTTTKLPSSPVAQFFIIAGPIVAVLALILLCLYFYRRRRGFSDISLMEDAPTTAIKVQLKNLKTASTSSSSSTNYN